MRSSVSKIQMTGFDDLFQTGGGAKDNAECVQEIPLSELFPFKDHPFQVRDDEAMRETAESIAKYGVLVPGIARPRPEGGYKIVAGHRRKRGCELAGKKETMPVLVRALDDDEATIIMVDSNLQRENTKLIPQLLALADEEKLAVSISVEYISDLSENEQTDLITVMGRLNVIPTKVQLAKIKKYGKAGNLTTAVIDAVLSEERAEPLQVTLKKDRLKQYFLQSCTAQQMEEVILSLLDNWRTQNAQS